MKNLKDYIIESKRINPKQVIKKLEKFLNDCNYKGEYYDKMNNVLEYIGGDAYEVVNVILSTKFSFNSAFSHPSGQVDKGSIVDLDLNFGSGVYSFEYNDSYDGKKEYTIYRDSKQIGACKTDKYTNSAKAKQDVRLQALIDVLSKAQDIWNK